MTGSIYHATLTGAGPDTTALIDGPKYDAAHTLSGQWSPSQGGTGVANNDTSTITISGSFGITFTITATTSLIFPPTGTLATLAGSETLTNKSINLANNTLTGTTAQFNTALSDNDFATLAGSEALTNKTIGNTNTVTLKDTLFTLQDDGDTTKQVKFQLSGISTATTRTYALPNADDTLVGKATTDTFTNKTYDTAGTGNSFSINGVAVTANTGTGAVARAASPTFTGTVNTAALTAGGAVNVTYASPIFTVTDTGTSFAYFQCVGSGGGTAARIRFGSESGTGGSLFTGSAANAGVLGTVDNNPFQIFTNFTLRATFNAAGGTTFAGSVLSNTATGGIGYGTGAGGPITQITNRNTGVTLNTVSGAITLFSAVNAAVSGATASRFTVTNSAVAATDTVIINQKSGTDRYLVYVTAVAAGSFAIEYFSPSGGTTNEAPVFNFNVIKGVAS